jgi:hypothetical protein
MSDKQKKEKLDFTSAEILSAKSKIANVAFIPELTEKDKRAKERLKNHPIPKEFLKNK